MLVVAIGILNAFKIILRQLNIITRGGGALLAAALVCLISGIRKARQ
jgi:hypothetical protein